MKHTTVFYDSNFSNRNNVRLNLGYEPKRTEDNGEVEFYEDLDDDSRTIVLNGHDDKVYSLKDGNKTELGDIERVGRKHSEDEYEDSIWYD